MKIMPMSRKIWQGLQFKVYEYTNGKVLKKPLSVFEMIVTLIKWTPNLLLHPIDLLRQVRGACIIGNNSIQFIKESAIDKNLLWNPIFHGRYIEQDRVEILWMYLDIETHLAKLWVDKYILFIFECWKNGFSDWVFNLTLNNGINWNGEVILIDIGELITEKSQMVQIIQSRAWEKSWSLQKDMKKWIQEYYQNEMWKHITVVSLDKYWLDSNPNLLRL